MAKKGTLRKLSSSGAVGGPATGGGISFQVEFAVAETLDAICFATTNPVEHPEISMEPRTLVDGKLPTCWDIRRSPPETLTEAKLNPTRTDILDWLDRVETAVRNGGNQNFQLLYSRGSLRLLTAIDALRRLAVEANGDAKRFANLVTVEPNDDIHTVLTHLKTEPHRTFARIRLKRIDPTSQDDRIRYQLQFLVREADRQRLRDFLYAKLAKGVEQRATYRVRELMDEVQRIGIQLCAPLTFEPSNLEPLVGGAFYVLQHCKVGFPAEVLAGALNCTQNELVAKLGLPDGGGIFLCEGDMWTVAPLNSSLVWPDGPKIIELSLLCLLDFIRANRLSASGRRQIANAVALAKLCQHSAPTLVSSVFRRLDKMLKRTGNKRLVLDVANLSIAAARRLRTDETARDEAVALICGRSWALQRIGQLREARAAGERSLDLGLQLNPPWDRNTAFCYKCLGRLTRLEAERLRPSSDQFERLIAASRNLLEKAIHLFPQVSETNLDREGEVGDCYSLMGRTCMTAGDLRGATAAAREASSRITDATSKDFADLQILLGDIAAARGNKDAAISHYDEVIASAGNEDAERSEIAARAHFRKGIVTRSSHCLDSAAAIWADLEEDENADNARWHSLVFSKKVPAGAEKLLSMKSPSIRVEALRIHAERLAALPGGAHGRRSEPDKKYWERLIDQAQTNVAISHVDWE